MNTIELKLHPEDETLVVFNNGSETRTYRVQPVADARYVVTAPNGDTATVGCAAMPWGTLWTDNNGGTVREYHDNSPIQTEVRAKMICAVLAWHECRAAYRVMRLPVTEVRTLAQRWAADNAALTALTTPDTTPLSGFMARHSGKRIGR